MRQPIKQSNRVSDIFSKELTTLINFFVSEFANVYGINYVTTESFVYIALGYKDSLCYKIINSIISDDTIEELRDTIYEYLDLSPKNIGGKFDITRDKTFKEILEDAAAQKDKTGSRLITSDHILLSILSKNQTPRLCGLLQKNNVTYTTVIDSLMELHGIVNKVYKKEEETKVENIVNNDNKQQNKQGATVAKKVEYCTNLNLCYKSKQINKTYGRENIINDIFITLSRRDNNNVILMGEKGVGKTQCVYGVIEKVCEGISPLEFRDKTFLKLNTSELFAGASLRGALEERVLRLIKSILQKKDCILVIDDLYAILGQKHTSGDIDVGILFESVFSNPNIQTICCCTPKEFKDIRNNYTDVLSNFNEIKVDKLSVEECITLLGNIIPIYENYHKVKYDDGIIRSVVNLCDAYISDKCLPSSAIDIIDKLGAYKKINSQTTQEYISKQKDIKELSETKDKYITSDSIDEALKIDKQIEETRKDICCILKAQDAADVEICDNDVYTVFSSYSGIEISNLCSDEKERLSNIEKTLKEKVIGQDEAIVEIVKAMKRSAVGLTDGTTPRLSILEIGSSGVGKTLIAKTLAKYILGNEKYLIRFDMSEYADETSINKLIGSSAGYVGYNDGGLLTEAIKNNKYCVLLLDEIEKAHKKVFNLFLQILDDGFLTDNMGQKVDFRNTYIIMTSNVGTKEAFGNKSIGFENNDSFVKEEIIKKSMKNVFPPEFLNRFDKIVFFNQLTTENLAKIIELNLSYLVEKVKKIGYSLTYTKDVITCILEMIKGDTEYGARPINRVIKNNIETQITDLIIENEESSNGFEVVVDNNKLTVSRK